MNISSLHWGPFYTAQGQGRYVHFVRLRNTPTSLKGPFQNQLVNSFIFESSWTLIWNSEPHLICIGACSAVCSSDNEVPCDSTIAFYLCFWGLKLSHFFSTHIRLLWLCSTESLSRKYQIILTWSVHPLRYRQIRIINSVDAIAYCI